MDPTTDLITAMRAALVANTALIALVPAARIYDRAPDDQDSTNMPTAEYPFISLGPIIGVPTDDDCATVDDITVQWDVWVSGDGESYGKALAAKIVGLIKRTLHDAELALTNNGLIALICEQTKVLDDPNPAIRHGVVVLTGSVQSTP